MRRILTIYLIISFGVAALSYLVFCFFPPPLSARSAALLIGGAWPLLLLIGGGMVWIAYRVVTFIFQGAAFLFVTAVVLIVSIIVHKKGGDVSKFLGKIEQVLTDS